MIDEVEEIVSKIKNSEVIDFFDNPVQKMELLKNLFSCLIENFEVCYVIDGNMDELKNGRLLLSFESSGDDTKFILRSEDNHVFTGLLKDYYIDQCRGGGSPFLFRNNEAENKGIAIRFTSATRFYDEYEDKELGAKLKGFAKDYYDVWLYENRNLKYWNYSQFGYKD